MGYKVRVHINRDLGNDFGIGQTKKPYKSREGAEKRAKALRRQYSDLLSKYRGAKVSIIRSK
jgi:hypothetical protein